MVIIIRGYYYSIETKLSILICSGYMAPEYAMLGQFSVKSDVFSFGVLILEIVSGQKITRFHDGENIEHLLSYVSIYINWYIPFFFFGESREKMTWHMHIDIFLQAWENWSGGTASNLIDPMLRGSPAPEIIRCIHIGLLCVQQNVSDNSVALPAPTQPASFMSSNVPSTKLLHLDSNSRITKYEVSITELYPR
jgi:hypothetical protein